MLKTLRSVLHRIILQPTTREERNIRRLMVFTALFGVVNGGVITFLPVLLARLGATAMVISLLTSLPALVTIAFALPAGAIVARWRDMVRLSSYCFYALRLAYIPMMAALLMDASLAPYLIVLIWALTSIPGTMGNTAFFDVLADSVAPERRATINGVRWALLGLVSALSVSLFGILLVRLTWPANYLTLFGICFVAGICSTVFYSRLEVPLREPQSAPRERIPLRKRLTELAGPLHASAGFRLFSLVTFVMRLGLFLPAGLFSLFLVRDLQVSDAWIGGRTTLELGALTVGYFFWGRMANRLGTWRMLTVAVTAIGVALLLVSQTTAETLWPALVSGMIGGFFASALDVSLFEWLLAVMPPGERPRYVAMNTLLMNLVAFFVPMGGAALADRTSIPLVLTLAGCVLFVCALLTYLRARPLLSAAHAPTQSAAPAAAQEQA